MGHRHPLGCAGGAGGVDHIGGAARSHTGLGAAVRERVGLRVRLGGERADHQRVLDRRGGVGQLGLGQQHRHGGVPGHEGEPLPGVLGVQAEVGGAGLEHPEDRPREVRAAFQADADHGLGVDPQRAQPPGDPVAGAVELAVAGDVLPVEQGGGLRAQLGVPLDQFVEQPPVVVPLVRVLVPGGGGALRGGGVPAAQHQVAGGAGEGGPGDRAVRRGRHRPQQAPVAVRELFAGGGVQVAGVGVQGHAARVGVQAEREVGAGDLQGVLPHVLLQPVEVHEVEDGLDRHPAEGALHLGEREPPVRQQGALGGEGLAQVLDPGAGGGVEPDRDRVEEQAAQQVRVGVLGAAVGDHADAVRVVPGEEVHQPVEGREEDRPHRDPGLGGDPGQRLGQLPVGALGLVRRLVADQGRTGGRGEVDRLQADQRLVPEGAGRGGGQCLALQRHVVREAHRGPGRRGGFQPGRPAVVLLHQVRDERGQAPAVEHHVAVGDGQPELPLAEPVHEQPYQRGGGQVEGQRGLLAHMGGGGLAPLGRGEAAQVGEAHRQRGPPVHQLQRLGVAQQVEGGAQDVVALDQGVHGLLERAEVEAGAVAQLEAGHVVVGAALRIAHQLVQHARLEHGQRIGVLDARGQRGRLGAADHGQGSHRRRLDRRRRVVGQVRQLRQDLGPEDVRDAQRQPGLAGQPDHPQGQDGVAAQAEEVVVHADPVEPQDRAPDPGQRLLGGGARRGVPRAEVGLAGLEQGQRLAVDLAVHGQRQRRVLGDQGRDHVVGQAPAEVGAQLAGVDRGAGDRGVGAGGDVADQPPHAARLLADHHGGVHHPGEAAQRGLDLAQLDPEAADLDLCVHPAQELQLPVGQPPDPVAGPVQPAAGRSVGVGHKTLGGQRRASQVAPGQTRPGDVQLARDADRYQPLVLVEHVSAQVRQRHPDRRQGVALGVRAGQHPVGDVHGGLGDPVHVHQSRPVRRGIGEPVAEVPRAQRVAAEDDRPQGEFGERAPGLRGLRPQALEGGGGLAEHGDPLGGQQVEHRLRVPDHVLGGDHHAPAPGQRPPQLPDREVEGEGVQQRPDVVRAEVEPRLAGGEQPGGVVVGDHHALRTAGGAGGVDDVGGVAGPERGALDAVQVGAAGAVQRAGRVQHQDLGAQLRDLVAGGAVGEQQGRPGVVDHEPEALGRVGAVHRQVGPAGLPDPQHRDREPGVAAHADADPGLRAHPAQAQRSGHPLGPLVELRVAEALARAHQRDLVGAQADLLLEGVQQQRHGRGYGRVGVPRPRQQRRAFLLGQRLQGGDRRRRAGGDRVEHPVHVVGQGRDRLRVEQVAPVDEGERQPVRLLGGVQ